MCVDTTKKGGGGGRKERKREKEKKKIIKEGEKREWEKNKNNERQYKVPRWVENWKGNP